MERKPRARRQAQVEEFAHFRVKKFSKEQELFLQFSDELSRNVIKDPEHIPDEYPEQLKQVIYNYWDSYVHFLRELKEESRLAVELAESNARLYEEVFSGPVKRLHSRIKREGEQSSGFLGKGSNGAAYAVEVAGHEYAVKLGGSAVQANFDIRPLIRAKGIPKVAETVAYSFEDHAVVMERLPGKDVTQLSEHELNALTDQQIIELIETVQHLARRGLVIDPKPSNFMYDVDQGFGVLDYHIAHEGSSGEAQQIMSLRLALSTKQDQFKWPSSDDAEGESKMKKHRVESQQFYLPRLIQFVQILTARFPEVIKGWKLHRERMVADPRRSGGEFLHKDYFETSNSDIARYVAQLEELDDDWIFL